MSFSDSDSLDDIMNEVDLDDLLDDAFAEEGNPSTELVEVMDPFERAAFGCLSNEELRAWKSVIDKDMLMQQALIKKNTFSHSYISGMQKKQQGEHGVVENKKQGLVSRDKTMTMLLREAFLQSKFCAFEHDALELIQNLLEDPKTTACMKKVCGGYRHRFNTLMKARLNRDLDFKPEQFPYATKAFSINS